MSTRPHVLFGARHHRGDLREIGDVGVVRHRRPAGGANLFDDLHGVFEGAVSPDIVDDDFRATRRKPESM